MSVLGKQQAAHLPELVTAKDANELVKRVIGPDAEVVDYSIKPYCDEKIGFLGSHQRLIITTKGQHQHDEILSQIRLFVKSLPYEVSTQVEYVKEKGVFHQESNFYRNIVPELLRGFDCEPWSPVCYLIREDCFVFEDIGELGFSMANNKLLKENEIRAGLRAIARLHASSLHAESRLARKLNEICPGAFEERAFHKWGNQYRWFLAGTYTFRNNVQFSFSKNINKKLS